MMMDTFYTADRKEWRKWLEKHFETLREVWLVYPSKDSGEPCILYNDAVEEALCFGWIDSTIRRMDAMHRCQRFTPRNPKSTYSRPNIERLICMDAQGLVHPKVREKVLPLIKAPYVYPEDILGKIQKDEAAWRFFLSCPESYKRIRVAYIDDARSRPEEFGKRLAHFLKVTHDGRIIRGYGGIEKYYGRNLEHNKDMKPEKGIPMCPFTGKDAERLVKDSEMEPVAEPAVTNRTLDGVTHTPMILKGRALSLQIVKLSERQDLKDRAADWFSSKWSVPREAYLESITDSFDKVVPSWYLGLINGEIVAGMGVIENDFHDRWDLSPNVCAVYVEPDWRCQGIGGGLLGHVAEDMASHGICTLYLLTEHTGYYERYGWTFLCMAQGDGEDHLSRMYVHRIPV